MNDTVTVRREELEWLIGQLSRENLVCLTCPVVDGCRYIDHCGDYNCLSRLRAHFLPEVAEGE